jgi:tRNA threonylcarbamoyladenosine biosynthesis protein TsaE
MTITINSIEHINEAAHEFIEAMGGKKVFAFYGSMGAGKTTFIKAVCEQMGVEDIINSPTFAIVNEYVDSCDQPVYHFDFYRFQKEDTATILSEVLDIGYEDYVYGQGVSLIEWANLIEEILPDHYTEIKIEKELEKGFDYRRISVCEF